MKRFHVHVAVDQIEPGIRFYQALFGAEPTVRKNNYAKWMLTDPAVNFAISAGEATTGVSHLGLQVDDDETLDDIASRMQSAGLEGKPETDANCCYARSNKYWAIDPAGVPWESFRTLEATEEFGEPKTPDAAPCCENRSASGAAACCGG